MAQTPYSPLASPLAAPDADDPDAGLARRLGSLFRPSSSGGSGSSGGVEGRRRARAAAQVVFDAEKVTTRKKESYALHSGGTSDPTVPCAAAAAPLFDAFAVYGLSEAPIGAASAGSSSGTLSSTGSAASPSPSSSSSLGYLPKLLYAWPNPAALPPDTGHFCFPNGIAVSKVTPQHDGAYRGQKHASETSGFLFQLSTSAGAVYGAAVVVKQLVDPEPFGVSSMLHATTDVAFAPRAYCFVSRHPVPVTLFDLCDIVLQLQYAQRRVAAPRALPLPASPSVTSRPSRPTRPRSEVLSRPPVDLMTRVRSESTGAPSSSASSPTPPSPAAAPRRPEAAEQMPMSPPVSATASSPTLRVEAPDDEVLDMPTSPARSLRPSLSTGVIRSSPTAHDRVDAVLARVAALATQQRHVVTPAPASLPLLQMHITVPQDADAAAAAVAHWACPATVCALSLPVLLRALTCVLLEKHVVVLHPDLRVVTSVAFTLMQMLRPFIWQFVFVPVLPRTMHTVLEAPMPILVGLQQLPPDVPTSQLIIIDVAHGRIHNAPGIGLPGQPELQEKLQHCFTDVRRVSVSGDADEFALSTRDAGTRRAMKRTRIVREIDWLLDGLREYFSDLFTDLRRHCVTDVSDANQPVSVFIPESFLADVAQERDLAFLTPFFKTQMWNVYCDEMLTSSAVRRYISTPTLH